MTGGEQHEPGPAAADDGGLFLIDQTFTLEEGDEARRQVQADRQQHQADEPGESAP